MPLLNGFSEQIELASLLIKVEMSNPSVEDSENYRRVTILKDQSEQLRQEIEDQERKDSYIVLEKQKELYEIESSLLAINEARCKER